MDEVRQQSFAEVGVRHLGMKLQTVERQRVMPNRRMGAGVGRGESAEVRFDVLNLVAVAHPDSRVVRHVLDEGVVSFTVAERMPEFPRGAGDHLAFKRTTEFPHPVADAEDRDTEFENSRIGMRCTLGVHARRAAGEDQSLGAQFLNAFDRQVVADQLAEDLLISNPSGDELGGLRTEIEDQNAFFRVTGNFDDWGLLFQLWFWFESRR